MHLWTLLCLFGCVVGVALAGSCDVSAPRISLSELHSGCDADHKSRTPECAAAMHRFCQRVSYPSPITTLGVPRENANGKIWMSCVRSEWSGAVSINVLRGHYQYCAMHKSQHRDCLYSAQLYCRNRLGMDNVAGMIQEVYHDQDTMQVHCFQSPRIEFVPLATLQYHLKFCQYPETASAPCYASAKRWCSQYGHDGGITISSGPNGATVACYDAEFSNVEFVKRVPEFYNLDRHVDTICSLDFDIPQGQVLSATPEFIKTEMYDNRGSSVPLSTSFEVEKKLLETNSFTHSHSFSFGVSSSVYLRIPFFGGVDITTSYSSSETTSLTETNTREVSYSTISDVDVPAGKGIMKEALVNRVTLDVPWTAKIVNGLGIVHSISGQWQGVNTYNFRVEQEDLDGFVLCGKNQTLS